MSARWVCDTWELEHAVLGTFIDIHVSPIGDIQEHTLGVNWRFYGCPCGADRDHDGVILHDAFDGREIIEQVEAGTAV